jgi:hypothetical protein
VAEAGYLMSLLKQLEAAPPGSGRDTLVLQALCEARHLKLATGFLLTGETGLRGYLELPGAGMVSWALPPADGLYWEDRGPGERSRRIRKWTKAGSDE